MPTEITPKTIERADDLIEYLLRVTQEESRPISRGESDAGWVLRPSVWRGAIERTLTRVTALHGKDWHRHIDSVFDGPVEMAANYLGGDGSASSQDAVEKLALWLIAEQKVVRKFCAGCDRAALPVPGFSNASARVHIGEEWTSYPGLHGATPSLLTPVYELGPEFAFAQHYRIPTRLLDFTDTPLKAAYFAVTAKKRDRGSHFAIWVLRRLQEVRDAAGRLKTQEFRALRSQVPFLHAQDGLFIACNEASNRFFLNELKWPTLEQVLTGWTIEKIVCPQSIAEDVRMSLDRFGINRVTMTPAYETVSSFVRAQL